VLCTLALVGGAAIAGCGGGGSSPSSTTTTTTAAANKTTPSLSPRIAAAVNACKSSISSTPLLSSSEKNKLESICQGAAHGHAAGASAVTQRVCVQIVKDTIPSGSARTRALAVCNTVGSNATGASGASTTPSNGGGYAATVLRTECQSAQQLASAMPASLKNALTSACQKVAKGDIAGAKSQFKQLCEATVKALASGTERSSVAALCNEL
jgi:hypothetical protein